MRKELGGGSGWSRLVSTRSRRLKCCPWGLSLSPLAAGEMLKTGEAQTCPGVPVRSEAGPARPQPHILIMQGLHFLTLTQYSPISSQQPPAQSASQVITILPSSPPLPVRRIP